MRRPWADSEPLHVRVPGPTASKKRTVKEEGEGVFRIYGEACATICCRLRVVYNVTQGLCVLKGLSHEFSCIMNLWRGLCNAMLPAKSCLQRDSRIMCFKGTVSRVIL
jgi:hypothetical protein